MLQVPKKLFAKASALGFECFSNAQIHKILPPQATGNWTLVFQSGCWMLVINGVPQMNMSYAEVSAFLERRAAAIAPSRPLECVTDSHQIRRSA